MYLFNFLFLLDSAVHMNTLCNKLLREGAHKVIVCATHAAFQEDSLELIELSPVSKIILSDSIPLPPSLKTCDKIIQLSLAPLLANVIRSDITMNEELDYNVDNDEDDEVFELE